MQGVSPVCRVLADTFERPSGIPDALRDSGIEIEVVPLQVGDYDLGAGVLVERKSVTDLHLTLQRGRLWDQIGRLRRAARLPYLLIEGSNIDAGPTRPAALRGACLAVIGQGVAVLRSADTRDSALWLRLLADRANGIGLGRDRPFYAQRLKARPEYVPEAMIAAIPGISVAGARALLDHFGSVSAVVAADERELTAVRGIGPTRAAALRKAVS